MEYVDFLITQGGREWKNNNTHRVYFNLKPTDFSDDGIGTKIFGLDLQFYGTGNISLAIFNGERISNSEGKRKLVNFLQSFFYDINTKEWTREAAEHYFDVKYYAACSGNTTPSDYNDGPVEKAVRLNPGIDGFMPSTKKQKEIDEYEAAGYTIIVNRNPNWSPAYMTGCKIIRILCSNGSGGRCKWAAYAVRA